MSFFFIFLGPNDDGWNMVKNSYLDMKQPMVILSDESCRSDLIISLGPGGRDMRPLGRRCPDIGRSPTTVSEFDGSIHSKTLRKFYCNQYFFQLFYIVIDISFLMDNLLSL